MGIEAACPSPRRAGAGKGTACLPPAGPAAPESPESPELPLVLLCTFPLPAVSFADLGLSGTVCEMGKREMELWT